MEYEELAGKMEREAHHMERESEQLDDDMKQLRENYERQKDDTQVPGADRLDAEIPYRDPPEGSEAAQRAEDG